jgi:hypothetical protein
MSKRRRSPSKHNGVDLDKSGILAILQHLFNTKNKEVLGRTTHLLSFTTISVFDTTSRKKL